MAERDLARVRIKADDESKGGFDSFVRNAQEASRHVDGLSAGVGRLTALLGVGLSAGGFAAFTQQAIAARSALGDLSAQTALSVETLSSLERVAAIGGRQLNDVQPIAAKFAKSLEDARAGGEDATKALLGMNFSMERIKNGRFDDLFVEFARKIAGAKDQTLAMAYAGDLAGKSAAQNIPLFRDLAEEGLRQAKVTTQQAQEAEALEKSWRRLRLEGMEWKNDLMNGLIPALTNLVTQLRLAKEYGFAQFLTTSGDTARNPLGELRDVQKQIQEYEATIKRRTTNPTATDMLAEWLPTGTSITELQSGLAGLKKRRDYLTALAIGTSTDRDNFDAALMRQGETLQPRDKTTKSTAAEVESPFRTMMKGLLEEELRLRKELTAVDKLENDLAHQKADVLAKLTKAEREQLFEVARRIDLYKSAQEQSKSIIALIEAEIKGREELASITSELHRAEVDASRQSALDVQMAQLETQSLQTFGKTQQQILEQTLEFNIAKETALRLDKLRREEMERLSKLNENDPLFASQVLGITGGFDRLRDGVAGQVRAEMMARSVNEQLRANQQEAQRFADDLNRSLTDALLRGFESGKDFGRNFFDTLKNMAQSLVLRPVLQFVLSPISGAITGTLAGLGIPGLANASGGGIGGALSSASSLSSLFGGSGSLLSAAGEAIGGSFGAGLTYAGSSGVGVLGGLAEAVTGGGSLAFGLGAAVPAVGIALAAASALGLFGSKKTPAVGQGYQFNGSIAGGSLQDIIVTGLTNKGTEAPGSQLHNEVYAGAFSNFGGNLERMLAPIIGADAARGVYSTSASFGLSQGMGVPDAQTAVQLVRSASNAIIGQLAPGLREMAQANEELIDTLERVSSARKSADLEGILARMSGVLSARDDVAALRLSDLSPLTASQRLAYSQTEYARLFVGAEAGDLTSINMLGGGARNYLAEARSYYASSPAYTSIFEDVQSSVDRLAADTLDEQSRIFKEMGGTLEDISDKLDKMRVEMVQALTAAAAQNAAAVVQSQEQAAQKIVESNAETTILLANGTPLAAYVSQGALSSDFERGGD